MLNLDQLRAKYPEFADCDFAALERFIAGGPLISPKKPGTTPARGPLLLAIHAVGAEGTIEDGRRVLEEIVDCGPLQEASGALRAYARWYAMGLWKTAEIPRLKDCLKWIRETPRIDSFNKGLFLELLAEYPRDTLATATPPVRPIEVVQDWAETALAVGLVRKDDPYWPGVEPLDRALVKYLREFDLAKDGRSLAAVASLAHEPGLVVSAQDYGVLKLSEKTADRLPEIDDETVRLRFGGRTPPPSHEQAAAWLSVALRRGLDDSTIQCILERAPESAVNLLNDEQLGPKTLADYRSFGRGEPECSRRLGLLLDATSSRAKMMDAQLLGTLIVCGSVEGVAMADSKFRNVKPWYEKDPGRSLWFDLAQPNFARAVSQHPAAAAWAVANNRATMDDLARMISEGCFPEDTSSLPAPVWSDAGKQEFRNLWPVHPVPPKVMAYIAEGGAEVDHIACLGLISGLGGWHSAYGNMGGDEALAHLADVARRAASRERAPDDDRLGALLATALKNTSAFLNRPSGTNLEGGGVIPGSKAHLLAHELSILRKAGIKLTEADAAKVNGAARDLLAYAPPMVPALAELMRFGGSDRLDAIKDRPEVQRVLRVDADWRKRIGMEPPLGLSGVTCYGFRSRTFAEVRPKFDHDPADAASLDTVAAANVYAYNLTCLFGTKERIDRYVNTHRPGVDGAGQRPGARAYMSMAQFTLPPAPPWNISEWAGAALRDGPDMAKYVRHARPGESPPRSLAEANDRFATQEFPKLAEHPELARLCAQLKLDPGEADALLVVHRKVDATRAGRNIPAMRIPGERFGMPGYDWSRAPAGDPRILVAGELVNCCQHVNGQAREAAIHSATSPDGACFFLEKRTEDAAQAPEVLAASWAWRGKEGELCFDSYEAIGERYLECVPKLLAAIREEVAQRHPDIPVVTLGSGGGTPDLNLPRASKPAKPVEFDDYRDSHDQYLVLARERDEDLRVARSLQNEVAPLGVGLDRA